jgi:hypothetical protein
LSKRCRTITAVNDVVVDALVDALVTVAASLARPKPGGRP